MIDSVVFDLDGTLLYTLEDLCDAVNYCMDKYGFPRRTLEEVRHFVGNGIRILMERSVPDGLDGEQFERVFETFRVYYTENSNHKTRIYPGIDLLLDELKARGYKLAIVSNKNDQAVKKLNDIYFSEQISVAVGAKDGMKKKPEPDSVLLALDCLESSPEHALYVGDSEVDVATAANAGCDLMIVSWGFRTREELERAGAERITDRWQGIIEYLESVNHGKNPDQHRNGD